MNYWELPGFEGVYLEDSWVLAIRCGDGVLSISADLVLRESHPAYRTPQFGEQYCYQRGLITFDNVSQCLWADRGLVPATDASGEEDLGSLDHFDIEDGSYVIAGDFGRIVVVSDAPRLSLTPK